MALKWKLLLVPLLPFIKGLWIWKNRDYRLIITVQNKVGGSSFDRRQRQLSKFTINLNNQPFANLRASWRSSLAPYPVPLFSSRFIHVPPTSTWIHSTPSSTNFWRKAAAIEAPGAVSYASLKKSAELLERSSKWLSSSGRIQLSSFTSYPADLSNWRKVYELPKRPARSCPKAITQE